MRIENLKTSISDMSYEEIEALLLQIRKLRVLVQKKKVSKKKTINLSDVMVTKKISKKPNLKALMSSMSEAEKLEILKMFKGE